ncbi:hypothetical protein [Xanthomonas sp. NCPPB 2632]|uniref:hypothetical protein n=1 Tax=Xanthomonas sp. NCPPB 2632 TaxID=3240912 RepID=UPI003517E04D
MSTTHERLTQFVADAMEEGDVKVPVALLEALQAESNPLDASWGGDGAQALSVAMDASFPLSQQHSLWLTHGDGKRGDVTDLYVALMRWFRSASDGWVHSTDGSRALFACLLITARMCGGRENLWDALPDACRPSVAFLAEAAGILARNRVRYDKLAHHEVPIWEGEFVQQFDAHDDAGQWDEIAQEWPRLSSATHPNLYLGELARCLARFDMKAIAVAADAQPKVPAVLMMSLCLSRGRQLELATHCTSKRATFCMVLSVAEGAGRQSTLSETEHNALVAVLARVMLDKVEWQLWMKAFNRYPVRYPWIQAPLGEMLASAPTHAIEAYVDSIILSSYSPGSAYGGEGRQGVAVCLRRFASHASLATQQVMWRHAFQRWSRWRRSVDSHLSGHFDVQWSELDFAVTSYVAQCLSASERDQAMGAIWHELCHLDEVWHSSVTEYITQVHVLLSLYQPYAHVAQGAFGSELLAINQIYWPFDFKGSAYLRRLFHVNVRG